MPQLTFDARPVLRSGIPAFVEGVRWTASKTRGMSFAAVFAYEVEWARFFRGAGGRFEAL